MLVGSSACGCTQLINVIKGDSFLDRHEPTEEMAFHSIRPICQGIKYRLLIYETCAAKQLTISQYVNKMTGLIFVFDLTNPDSLNNIVSAIEKCRDRIQSA